MTKSAMKVGVIFVLLCLTSGGILAFETYRYLHSPITHLQVPPSKLITIPKGAGFNQIVQILAEHGVLDQPNRFRLLAYFRDLMFELKAGEYEVQTSWTPNQMLDHLVEGRSQLYKVTIPEGLTFEETAERFEQAGIGKKENFLLLKDNLSLREMLDITPVVASLEGFLFPETYFFTRNDTEMAILTAMIQQFNQNYPDEYRRKAAEYRMTDYEVVTLASIVEKETGRDQDRPLISAVFHNRLKRKMRLESDPTVIYGIDNFDGNLTRKHLKTPHPYNTYRNFGLPPGPICNPGKASIQSTLYPEKVSFLYFVSRGDGTSYFSSDLKTHNKAVRRYQKKQ
ncbi:MAG: endolytic transglycosylase MltG [SAR324 cluster bacterium]|nr:endolytic transglycosylase MltG [SAR324 cluster bacterium]